MDIYAKIGHSQFMGEVFFRKGLKFTIDKEVGKAYEFFKLYLDFTTCNCNMYKLLNSSTLDKINYLESETQDNYEYYFVKAFLMSFQDNHKNLYQAIDLINNYIKLRNDEYGQYILGYIYYELKQYDKSLIILEKIKPRDPRVLYLIARVKEEGLIANGFKEMYHSFIDNPSSSCAIKELNRYFKNYNINIEFDSHKDNNLAKLFASGRDLTDFAEGYKWFFRKQLSNPENREMVQDFILFIKMNSERYIENTFPPISSEIPLYKMHINNDDDNNNYYDENLDLDQQSEKFWDSL